MRERSESLKHLAVLAAVFAFRTPVVASANIFSDGLDSDVETCQGERDVEIFQCRRSTYLEDWISVREAAAILEISPAAVYGLMNRGTLGAKVIGLRRLVSKRAVRTLANNIEYRKRSRRPEVQQLELGGLSES